MAMIYMKQPSANTEGIDGTMQRILLMLFSMFFRAMYYFSRIWWYSIQKTIDYTKSFYIIKKATKAANKAGRVTIEPHGLENLPKENGFVMFPNHQGLFDVLAFLESCPVPFGFVIKKEASQVILLKQVMKALGSLSMDRSDIKQSMEVINEITREVMQGRNFLIFPEGTRSKNKNVPLDFKAGSFKSAMKAKCPIVPCAIIDSFVPFDEKHIRPVTVKVLYLEPLYYEEYKELKSTEIAVIVRTRIVDAIDTYLKE